MNIMEKKPLTPVRGGVELECKHCGSRRFAHRKGQLNTAVLSFFDLDWLNPSADVYVCKDCGFLHWFFATSYWGGDSMDDAPLHPVKAPPDDTSGPTECLPCRKPIPAGTDACPTCGWSYRSSDTEE